MVEPARPGSSPESYESASITPPSDLDSDIKRLASRSLSVPPSLGVPIRLDRKDRVDLVKLATEPEEGIGNKGANLVQLEAIGFNVPDFKGLSNGVVMNHILRAYPGFLLDYAAFVETKDITMLSRIREGVERAFSSTDVPELPGLRDWVRLHPRPERFAVRSTGYEDSDDVANAGANTTVLYVESSIEALSEAVKTVVISYFSDSSMLQRMASGDPSLSSPTPFVPVLLQVMISGDASGVMVVREGLSEIAAGIGLNQGVVAGESLTDKFIFRGRGAIRSVVQNKPTGSKGVAQEGGEVVVCSVPCPRDVAERPALSQEVAKRLQMMGNSLREFYGKDLDIEFTVKDGEVYLLQVRPLKERPPERPPSYLERAEGSIQAETITNGGNFVREITNSNQLLVVRTIEEARERFTLLRGLQNGIPIEGVVIQERAPRTSHGAIFFMGLGLPVLQTTKKLEMREGDTIYLDPQQGVVARGGEIREGYISYPIPLQYSMALSPLVMAMYRQVHEPDIGRGQFIKRELAHLDARIAALSPAPEIGEDDLPAALEVIKRGSLEDAKTATSSLVRLIDKATKERDITHNSRIELFLVLENLLDILEKDPLRGDSMTLDRLYTARLIEASLFQTGKGMIGGFSFTRCLRSIKMQRLGTRSLGKPHLEENFHDIPFVKMKLMILKEEDQALWGEMIKHLEEVSEEDKAVARDLFLNIDAVGASTEFANVTLVELMKKHRGDIRALFSEIRAIAHELEPLIGRALSMHEFVLSERANLTAWSDPEHIAKNFERVKMHLVELGFSPAASEIVTLFRSKEDMKKIIPIRASRLILISGIREVVGCYDDLIKQCTGPSKHTCYKDKASDFLKLLHPYKEMVKLVFRISGKPLNDNSEDFKLLKNLRGISEEQARELMEIPPDFDVGEIIQGVTQLSDVHDSNLNDNLEAKFTLFHQSIMKKLSEIAFKNGFSEKILPLNLLEFSRKYLKIGEFNNQISSIQVFGGSIQIEIPARLRCHSAVLVFNYEKSKRSMNINIFIYGHNELNRWNQLSRLAGLVGEGFKCKLSSAKPKEDSLSLAFLRVDESVAFSDETRKMIGLLLKATSTLADRYVPGEYSVLEDLPIQFQTRELCLEEVGKNPLAIRWVAREFLYDVTERYPEARRYLPDPEEFFLDPRLELPRIEPLRGRLEDYPPPPPYVPPEVGE